MKHKHLILLLILIVFIISSCSSFRINGRTIEEYTNARGQDYGLMLLGMVASFGLHTVGHLAYLEGKDKEWHIEGIKEIVDDPLTNHQYRQFARAGFLTQLVGGLFIEITPLDRTWFGTGYHIATAGQIWTYPVRHRTQGDLCLLNKYDGDPEDEWMIYSAISGYYLITPFGGMNADR